MGRRGGGEMNDNHDPPLYYYYYYLPYSCGCGGSVFIGGDPMIILAGEEE